MALCLSVRLSQLGSSVERDERIGMVFGMAASFHTNKQRLLFLAAKGWIKSTCTRKHIEEIHTNINCIKRKIGYLQDFT